MLVYPVQNYDTPSMPGSVSISMPETWRDTGHKARLGEYAIHKLVVEFFSDKLQTGPGL